VTSGVKWAIPNEGRNANDMVVDTLGYASTRMGVPGSAVKMRRHSHHRFLRIRIHSISYGWPIPSRVA